MALEHTRGFRTALHRHDHFTSHKSRLRVSTADEYETIADLLLGNPCPASALEFTRSRNGDLVRYDPVQDVFAVLSRDGFIKTRDRPDPAFHQLATNMDYYRREEANR